MVGKEHICSCKDCLIGNILKCEICAGRILPIGEDDDANSDDDNDVCNQGDDNQHEALEVHGKCNFDAVEKGASITLFLPRRSAELFCLCSKVLDMKVAKEDICAIYDHAVSKGDKYI